MMGLSIIDYICQYLWYRMLIFFLLIIISHVCIEFDFQVQKLGRASPLEPKSLFGVGLVQLLEVSRNFHGGLLQLIVA